MSDDPSLLDAEPAIVARLRERITDVEVTSLAALAAATNITTLLPAICVQPDATAISDTKGDGTAQVEHEQWLVFACVALVPDKRYLDATYQDAGVLMARIRSALTGLTSGPRSRPLTYAGRPTPKLQLGWGAFPVAFRRTNVLRD